MSFTDQIKADKETLERLVGELGTELDKFLNTDQKQAGKRARAKILEISKLCSPMRKLIQDEKVRRSTPTIV